MEAESPKASEGSCLKRSTHLMDYTWGLTQILYSEFKHGTLRKVGYAVRLHLGNRRAGGAANKEQKERVSKLDSD